MPSTIKRVALFLGAACVVLLSFLAYSVLVTFSNWPWTRAQEFREGSYLGLTISSDKRSAFDTAIRLQRSGKVDALELLDSMPTTYPEKYKGDPIADGDFAQVAASNRWHLGLSECSCWLVLDFSDGQLIKITRRDYRGPTE